MKRKLKGTVSVIECHVSWLKKSWNQLKAPGEKDQSMAKRFLILFQKVIGLKLSTSIEICPQALKYVIQSHYTRCACANYYHAIASNSKSYNSASFFIIILVGKRACNKLKVKRNQFFFLIHKRNQFLQATVQDIYQYNVLKSI